MDNDTFLKILDREKDEKLITKFVAFVIDPSNTTPLFLKSILEKTKSENDDANFIKLLNNSIDELPKVETEIHTENSGTPDIIIKYSDFWIMIENKVNAAETGNQSIRYENYGKNIKLPIKYILLKPNYNTYELQNKRFTTLYYDELADILSSIPKEKLKYGMYIDDFIRHCKIYLTLRETQESDLIKSNEIIEKLLEKVKKELNIPNSGFETHNHVKYNSIQIWKHGWNEGKEISNHKGLHYEIVFLSEDFENLNRESGVRVYIQLHNETMRERIPRNIIPRKQGDVNGKIYYFNTSENIEKSINDIILKLKRLIEETSDDIEKKILVMRECEDSVRKKMKN